MELGKISIYDRIAKLFGWLSILSGLIVLFLFNIGLLTNFLINLLVDFNLLILICLGSAGIPLFNKQHRSLGIWGLCIALFCIFFIMSMFILGWMVNPFP